VRGVGFFSNPTLKGGAIDELITKRPEKKNGIEK